MAMIRKSIGMWTVVFMTFFACLLSLPIHADDTFTCCMEGFKSIRSVVVCPRKCCDGYFLRSQNIPNIGPVTLCSKEAPAADVTSPKPASAAAPPAAAPPASLFHPHAAAFALNNQARQRSNSQQGPDKAQLRLRRVHAADASQEVERFPGYENQRLLCRLGPAPVTSSD